MKLKIINFKNYSEQENYYQFYVLPTFYVLRRNDKYANVIELVFSWVLWNIGILIRLNINK